MIKEFFLLKAAFDLANYEFINNPPPASWDSQLKVSYEDATYNANALISGSFFSFFLSLSYMISHCFHFYIYLIWSKPFRRALLQLFGWKDPTIAPATSIASLTVFSKTNHQQRTTKTTSISTHF